MAVVREGNVIRMTANNDTVQMGKAGFRILAVRLVSGIDAATALIKITNTAGAILFNLKVAANSADECQPHGIRIDAETLHLDLTGTSAEVLIYLG